MIPNLYQSTMYLLIVGGLAVFYASRVGNTASLAAVVLILIRAGSNGQQAQGAYQALRQSLPFVERLRATEARYLDSAPRPGRRPLPKIEKLAFEGVCFAYNPDRPVLSDVSFQVSAGETVGIIGPSGAGKSTIVQILLQSRGPGRGRYLVNDVPVDEFAPEDWHRRVAYVPQEPRLIHASVADNIRYFRAIDDAAVERAARLARIHTDIESWPNGYETSVGPRADAVSGGQQQRICLARALAARPEVLVLDEPTSALDPLSETLIQESLEALESELTMFIVAHRMSTLDVCDRVMVILDGQLAAFDDLDVMRRENDYFRSAAMLASGASNGPLAPSGHGDHSNRAGSRDARDDVAAHAPRTAAVLAQTASVLARVTSALARPTPGRLPDFFVVGQPKSGTTALYEMLRHHPQIFMPDSKEPWFFASELLVRTPPRPGGTPGTLAEYVSLFDAASPEQRVGEASALYLWSRTAAERIAEVQPEARIIAILREPASLLRSLHLQFVQTYVETENDLRKALALEDERRQGGTSRATPTGPMRFCIPTTCATSSSCAATTRCFPPDRVLVLIYDDFRRDNEAAVRQVLRFLEVDDSVGIEPKEANPTVRARSQGGLELLHAVSVGRGPVSLAVKGALKATVPRELRRSALHATQQRLIFTTPHPPDEQLTAELRRRYKPEVVGLSEYIDRDLVSLWGYDDVG